jgi:uncharacterized protein (TIGR00266 family)
MQRAHEIDYELIGDDMQIAVITLDPNETVIAEAGSMNWMEEDINYEAKVGDGSNPDRDFWGKLWDAGKRVITGESLFITHFTNQGNKRRQVSFGAPYPGKIIPIDLKAEKTGKILCQKDAFLCAAFGTKLDIAFTKKLGTGFFGGEGFILEELSGDGLVFVHAGGTIVKKELNNETLRIDTGCLVAFSPQLDYDIQRAGNLKSMLFGGEGLFLATIKGTGTVYIQSLPLSRLADRIVKHAPSMGGKRKGEGSILGSLGDLLDGDR